MPLPRDMTSQLSENNTPVISLNACRLAGIPSEPLFSVKALLLHHQHTFCDLKLYKITARCSILATESFSMGLQNWRWCLLSVPKQLSKYSSLLWDCSVVELLYTSIFVLNFLVLFERDCYSPVLQLNSCQHSVDWIMPSIQIQNISAVAISFF